MASDRLPTIKRLESGYFHIRWNCNLWIQAMGYPQLKDGFGWITDTHLKVARELIDREARDGQ